MPCTPLEEKKNPDPENQMASQRGTWDPEREEAVWGREGQQAFRTLMRVD